MVIGLIVAVLLAVVLIVWSIVAAEWGTRLPRGRDFWRRRS